MDGTGEKHPGPLREGPGRWPKSAHMPDDMHIGAPEIAQQRPFRVADRDNGATDIGAGELPP